MDYLRQIEEDLRNLGSESKRKYPEVKDATENALIKLKSMREIYVAEVMRKNKEANSDDKTNIRFSQSSDITAPYILSCNYVDANPKLISMALNGIQMLLNYEIVPPVDVKNVLRVLSIQAGSGKSEHQLKLLQILLLLVNSLSQNAVSYHYLTESTVNSFLMLALQLCDGRGNISVSSTALATARQVLAIVMDGATNTFFGNKSINSTNDDNEYQKKNTNSGKLSISSSVLKVTAEQVNASIAISAQLLIRDISLFMRSMNGEWLRGVIVPQAFALDLIYDALLGWKQLFQNVSTFKSLLKESIIPSLKPLLEHLQQDYISISTKSGIATSAALTSRIVKIARCILLDYITIDFIEEFDVIIILMIQSVQPECNLSNTIIPTSSVFQTATESISLLSGAGSLISRLGSIPLPLSLSKNNSTIGNTLSSNNDSFLRYGGGGMLTLSKMHTIYDGTSESDNKNNSSIPAHPVGACLEALLSFFLSEVPDNLFCSKLGCEHISSIMIITISNISNLIKNALLIENNVKLFESTIKNSVLINLLEGIMTGSEINITSIVKSVHEQLHSSTSISPTEVIILAVHLLLVVTRLLTKVSLFSQTPQSASFGSMYKGIGVTPNTSNKMIMKRSNPIFLPTTLSVFNFLTLDHTITSASMISVCENIYETVNDVCISLLTINSSTLTRRSLGILAELALTSGILGLNRPCEIIIASLCKYTVPNWQTQELRITNLSDVFKWGHLQACVRIIQVVHNLADIISDWDVIVDSFEQIIKYITLPSINQKGDGVTPLEIEKIISSIDRFKIYSAYLSDDSLVKLMTSLLAISMNFIAVNSTKLPSDNHQTDRNSFGGVNNKGSFANINNGGEFHKQITNLTYMHDVLGLDLVSFSLTAAVEITKYNSYRIATIWQMVTSHLRMIASLNSIKCRAAAVAATQDIILSALEYKQNIDKNSFSIPTIEEESSYYLNEKKTFLLSDEVMYNFIFPSFETSFHPRDMHSSILNRRVKLSPLNLQLSQCDLLSSLNSLSNIKHDDVKNDIISGLLVLLQGGGGEIINAGWSVIIDILTLVPTAMSPALANDLSYNGSNVQQWSKASLYNAFKCINLILDEFLSIIPVDIIKSLINCLFSFASQTHDVNISLTSVEMLWKVGDMSINNSSTSTGSSVIEFIMQRLLILSIDPRPEIRNCGMNTLFSAMTANAPLLNGLQWKQVFDEVIFPLFEHAEQKSSFAMINKEEALAPELKKGVKMAIHHSRDTAHKQWSETRSLALRGLSRVFKTCTKNLLLESWFSDTWNYSLLICKDVIQSASTEHEVALASIDVIFNMFNIVSQTSFNITSNDSESINKNKDNVNDDDDDNNNKGIDGIEINFLSARKYLWDLTWKAVQDIAKFSCTSQELPLHICQQLLNQYNQGFNKEYKNNENIKGLLDMMVIISRPRLIIEQNIPSLSTNHNRVAEVQLYQVVISLLKTIKLKNSISVGLLTSALCEIAFTCHYSQMKSFTDVHDVYLAPCSQKLRNDAGEYLMYLLQLSEKNEGINEKLQLNSTYDNNVLISLPTNCCNVILDIIFHRFMGDVCQPSILLRSKVFGDIKQNEKNEKDKNINKKTEKRTSMSEFFSTIGKMLSSTNDTVIVPLESKSYKFVNTLHKLNNYFYSENKIENIADSIWTSFIPLNIEIKILLASIKMEIKGNNFDVNNKLSQQKWLNIVGSLSCIISPWRKSEIPLESLDFLPFQEDVTLSNACKLIDSILNIDVISKISSSWSSILFNSITASTKLIIYSTLQENLKSDNDTIAIKKFHIGIFKVIMQKFHSIICDKNTSINVKKNALESYLTLLRDYCLKFYNNENVNIDNEQLLLLCNELCKDLLISLLDIEVYWNITPSKFNAVLQLPSIEQLLSIWLVESNSASFNSNESELSSNEGINHVNSSMSLNNKLHILVLLPLLIKLSNSSIIIIREASIQIINQMDLTSIVPTYTAILTRCENLENENRRLVEEMNLLKNASTLPF